jgi:hypothetical protein
MRTQTAVTMLVLLATFFLISLATAPAARMTTLLVQWSPVLLVIVGLLAEIRARHSSP